jgi:hypothetical protein
MLPPRHAGLTGGTAPIMLSARQQRGLHRLSRGQKKGLIRRPARKSFRRGCLKGTALFTHRQMFRKCEKDRYGCKLCNYNENYGFRNVKFGAIQSP